MKRIFPFLLSLIVVVTAQGQSPRGNLTYLCVVEQSRVGTVRKVNFSPYAEPVIERALVDAGISVLGGALPEWAGGREAGCLLE